MSKILAVTLGAVATAVATGAYAHHSFAMYDASKVWTFVGVVERYEWTNPHMHVILKVAPGAKNPATVGTWDIEGASSNIAARQGWTKASYKVGDPVVIVAHPMRDGRKGAFLQYALKDGKRLYVAAQLPIKPVGGDPKGDPPQL